MIGKVADSDWAMPIRVVPKKNGHVRIRGDYKVMISQQLEADHFPLTKL